MIFYIFFITLYVYIFVQGHCNKTNKRRATLINKVNWCIDEEEDWILIEKRFFCLRNHFMIYFYNEDRTNVILNLD